MVVLSVLLTLSSVLRLFVLKGGELCLPAIFHFQAYQDNHVFR